MAELGWRCKLGPQGVLIVLEMKQQITERSSLATMPPLLVKMSIRSGKYGRAEMLLAKMFGYHAGQVGGVCWGKNDGCDSLLCRRPH